MYMSILHCQHFMDACKRKGYLSCWVIIVVVAERVVTRVVCVVCTEWTEEYRTNAVVEGEAKH